MPVLDPYRWSFELHRVQYHPFDRTKPMVVYKLICHNTKAVLYGNTVDELYDLGKATAEKQQPGAQCIFFRMF